MQQQREKSQTLSDKERREQAASLIQELITDFDLF